jgi:hypothetical protein
MLTPSYTNDQHTVDGTAITPATITETKTITYFRVQVTNLDLFKSVSVSVTLLDETGNYCGTRNFTFEGAEYLAWNNDDSYLVNLVATKLGFTLA